MQPRLFKNLASGLIFASVMVSCQLYEATSKTCTEIFSQHVAPVLISLDWTYYFPQIVNRPQTLVYPFLLFVYSKKDHNELTDNCRFGDLYTP